MQEIRFSYIRYNANLYEEKESTTPEECVSLCSSSDVVWINVDGIHDTGAIDKIGELFKLHPLTVEDILNTMQRPKFEDFDSYLFIVLKMLSISDIEYRLGTASQELGIKYGLTGFSGSARFAPTVRYQRSMAYVQGELDPLIDLLEIKPVSSGSNVTLLKPYDEGVFYQSEERSGRTLRMGL